MYADHSYLNVPFRGYAILHLVCYIFYLLIIFVLLILVSLSFKWGQPEENPLRPSSFSLT